MPRTTSNSLGLDADEARIGTLTVKTLIVDGLPLGDISGIQAAVDAAQQTQLTTLSSAISAETLRAQTAEQSINTALATTVQNALGTPTSLNVASQIVKRDVDGNAAFSILEIQRLAGAPEFGEILNIQSGSQINLLNPYTQKMASFDMANGMLNLSSNDPFGIVSTDSDLILSSANNLYLNAPNVLCPAPTSAYSCTTKSYVDQAVQNSMAGLAWKNPVRLKTVAALPAYTATGTVALRTYTANSNGALSVDTVAVAVGDRILLDQSNIAVDSGIFSVVSAGSASTKWILQRTQDANNDPGVEVVSGMGMCVTEGTLAGDKQYVLTTNNPITLGTTALNFALFSAGTQTMLGEVTGTTGASVLLNSAVIGKLLTGFASSTGTVAATDSLLAFANKTTGNLAALTTTVGTPSSSNGTEIVKRGASGEFSCGAITSNGLLAGRTFRATSHDAPNGQGTHISWSRSGASTNAMTSFGNLRGLGSGGWEWVSYDSTATFEQVAMTLDRNGNLKPLLGITLPTTGGTAASLNH